MFAIGHNTKTFWLFCFVEFEVGFGVAIAANCCGAGPLLIDHGVDRMIGWQDFFNSFDEEELAMAIEKITGR